jgi:hypothetical protein
MAKKKTSSSGHKLGQIIGDWYEEYFAYPVLQKVADELGLYIDSRFKQRECRGEKIIWEDIDGNAVDYDFVLELGGTDKEKGIPVAFFETFWRRGSRHSKDKARDDSGKLLPLKDTFPTARVLGIISAGNFTKPAKELVISRGIDLFYIEKENIINSWKTHNITVDYPDNSTEAQKSKLAKTVIAELKKDKSLYENVAKSLIEIINSKTISSYILNLKSKIGAVPQKYSIEIQSKSVPIIFSNYKDVDDFLTGKEPDISELETNQYYSYRVDFFDGTDFYRDNLSWDEILDLHNDIKRLTTAMENKK